LPSALIILSSIAELFGLFLLGWFIRRRGYAGHDDLGRWGRICTELFYPLLIFHSIITGFDPGRVQQLWLMPALALGLMAAGMGCGLLLRFALQNQQPPHRRTFVHCCTINNFVYLPIFIIQNSPGLPPTALADFFVFNLGSTIGFWTLGVLTLGGHDSWRSTLKHLFSPAILSMFAAIALAWTGTRDFLPAPLLGACKNAGSIAVPLMLVIIGASLHGSFQRSQSRDLAFFTGVRLILLPLIYIAIIRALPLSPDLEILAIIVALMPTSAVSPMMARLYGGEPAYAASATLLTHLAALVTVPLAFWWLSQS
jgi:predicted permease